VKLRCRRCRRLIGEAIWFSGAAVVTDPVAVEGGFANAGNGTRRRGPRWRDHTRRRLRPDRSGYDYPGPPRYGWDCGSRHRGHTGLITSDRLTSLYEAAVRHGEDTIWLPP
jgi:hypothetical protein